MKYGNKITMADGIRFHSKKEEQRYQQLKVLLRSGHIDALRLQPSYTITIGEVKICKVILDFEYFDTIQKKLITEDVKGKDTAMSKLKRKLVEAQHHIKVELR